jgi:hypothetical protein
MKTTVDVFISYCFNPCCAGSIVTAVFADATIADATPADLLRVRVRVAYGTGAQHAMAASFAEIRLGLPRGTPCSGSSSRSSTAAD